MTTLEETLASLDETLSVLVDERHAIEEKEAPLRLKIEMTKLGILEAKLMASPDWEFVENWRSLNPKDEAVALNQNPENPWYLIGTVFEYSNGKGKGRSLTSQHGKQITYLAHDGSYIYSELERKTLSAYKALTSPPNFDTLDI